MEGGTASLERFPSPAVAAEADATSQSGVLYLWETAVGRTDLISGPSEEKFLYPSSQLVCGSH